MAERAKNVNPFKHRLIDHYKCIHNILTLYDDKQKLDKLSLRPDIQTICAYEYYKLKKGVMEEGILEYKTMHNHYFQNIYIPPPLN